MRPYDFHGALPAVFRGLHGHVARAIIEIHPPPRSRRTAMATALNLTVPLKQDPEAQQQLQELGATFAQSVQPMLDAALAHSQIVHFARILVIDNKYLQVLTEFDG